MMRGKISNTTSPTVWVMSEIVLEQKPRFFFFGTQEVLKREDWLWKVNEGYEAVIIHIGRSESSALSDYSQKIFKSFQEAVSAFRSDMRAGLFIVEDTAQTSPPEIVAYSRSAGIFNGY